MASASSCLMATQSTLFLSPTTSLSHIRRPAVYPLRSGHAQFRRLKPLFSSPHGPTPLKSKISSSSISPAPKTPAIKPLDNPFRYDLSGSTRTVTTLVATALTASKLFFPHGLLFSLALPLTKEPLLYTTAGPAFFAAARSAPLHTPFTVVAAGMAKWLDMYSAVLYVRVMLSWFPNIPWDKQPFSAMRDVCDPYLDVFKNIIPPIFDVLDVSSLLAFAVMGTLGSILNSSLRPY